MIILQIDSLATNQSFTDNFFWPLVLTIVVGIGLLIWNFIIKKTFKINIVDANSFIGQHNGKSYLIINVNLINKTQDSINGLTLTTNPMLTVRNGVFTMTQSGRLQGGGVLLPTTINLVNNVILNTPLTINSLSTVEGNIVIDINALLVNQVELTFSYLDKKIKKSVNINNLESRNI